MFALHLNEFLIIGNRICLISNIIILNIVVIYGELVFLLLIAVILGYLAAVHRIVVENFLTSLIAQLILKVRRTLSSKL